MSNNQAKTKSSAINMPHPVVILIGIILIVAIASYFVPAGQYARVEDPNTGRMVVDPSSYSTVESNPVGPFELFQSIPKGMGAAQEIIFFIMIVAGAFNIITATGAVESGIARVALKFSNNEKFMIPAIVLLFSLGGASFGMAEENIIFVPIGIALARALGYDAIVGMSIVVLGSACGFNAGVINPFTIGVAQGIAELPMFSGLNYRLIIWGVMVVVTSLYIMRYGAKVKADPARSYVHDVERSESHASIDLNSVAPLTGKQILVLLIVLAGFAGLVYGVLEKGWYILEIGSLFLAMGVIAGAIYGFGPNRLVKEFLGGVKDIAGGAIMVGIARAILVIMTDSMIIDTLVYSLSSVISALPTAISTLGMYVVQIIINFFIPSGSGQAAATMPIMIPLSDVLGINRQVAVLCYQFGDGFTNSIIPISSTLMALLGLSKIPYEKWVKFIAPLMGIWILLGGVFIVIANMMNYGPF